MSRKLVTTVCVCVTLVGGVTQGGSCAVKKPHYDLLFNLVHHNPGEPRFVTEFNDPRFLKELGYTGQIPKLEPQCGLTYDRYERGLVPLHSAGREWILRQAAEFRKCLAIAKKADCPVYPWIDILVLPKCVLNKYGREMRDEKGNLSILKPRTQALMLAQIDEFFWRYPDADGLTTRFGETYLHDTPYHAGGSPVNSIEEHVVLLKLLRDEVCVKRNKTVIYRTWTTVAGFHTSADYYRKVTDIIEPHPKLIFSIKHTQWDFARNIPFNPTIGIGHHPQIVEISMNQGGNYGKNAYPYYFARGIIDGFHDMQPDLRRGIRSLNGNPLVKGFWTWTWGDGWSGPFFDNELWLRLNEAVIRGFIQHPDMSEENLFNAYVRTELGLPESDACRFREFCLATEDAVYCGQHSQFGRCSDDMFWCRDNHFCKFNLDKAQLAGVVSDMLKEKRENVDKWRRLETMVGSIRFPRAEDRRFATVSTTYARIKYEISEILWRIMARIAEEKAGKMSIGAEESAGLVGELDAKYTEWDNLAASDPCCPTLYEMGFGWSVVIGPTIQGLRDRAKGLQKDK